MNNMNTIKITSIIIALFFFAACKKENVVSPKKLSADTTVDLSTIKLAPVFYGSSAQVVNTTLTGQNLSFAYTEKVALLVDSALYHDSWYIYFSEDFSKSKLAGMDYTTKLSWGVESTNYVPDNVNQVTKTVIDTIINQTKVVKIKFQRTFNFSKNYTSDAAANKKLDSLLTMKDHITFTTRYMPDSLHQHSVTTGLSYSKQ